MTDYVCFKVKTNEPISVNEYKQKRYYGEIKCVCDKNVFFKDDSIIYKVKGISVQKSAHFSHYKGVKCFIPKDKYKKKDNNNDDDNDKELSFEEKRLRKLYYLLKKIILDKKKILLYQEELKDIIKQAKYNDINYINFLEKPEYKWCNKLYYQSYNKNKDNYKYISFKDIPNIIIDKNIFYTISELDYCFKFTKNNNYFDCLTLSYKHILNIINDDTLYYNYLKQLSLILVYYSSRCYDADCLHIENQLICFKNDLFNSLFINE